jgi:hypothetical protein
LWTHLKRPLLAECRHVGSRPKADILVVSQIGRKPTATRSNDPAEGLEL